MTGGESKAGASHAKVNNDNKGRNGHVASLSFLWVATQGIQSPHRYTPPHRVSIIITTIKCAARWFLHKRTELYSLLVLKAPRGRPAAAQAGWVVVAESQGVCSQSVACLISRPSGLWVSCLGIWDHTVGGICPPGAAEEAQWAVRQNLPGSNGQLRCCETGHVTGGTGSQVGAGPPPTRCPISANETFNQKCKTGRTTFVLYFLLWYVPDLWRRDCSYRAGRGRRGGLN